MSVHQLIDPLVALDNLLGTGIAPGGKLHFYDLGTTTPKNTWKDADKAALNTNPVVLNSAGRVPYQVWGDGDYTVKFEAADGSTIVAAVEIRDPAPAAQSLPPMTGNAGKFLATDGTQAEWQPIIQLPDPSGSAGMFPVVNSTGDGYVLQSQPEMPEPEYSGSTSIWRWKTGSGDDMAILFGTGTAPASNAKATTASISFSPAFTKLMHVSVTTTGSSYTSSGALVDNSVTGWTAGAASSGVTVNFNVSDDDTNSSWKISTSIPFSWVAFGFVAPE